jgi:hypothetical protein
VVYSHSLGMGERSIRGPTIMTFPRQGSKGAGHLARPMDRTSNGSARLRFGCLEPTGVAMCAKIWTEKRPPGNPSGWLVPSRYSGKSVGRKERERAITSSRTMKRWW